MLSLMSGGQDLNLRPLRPERSALPGCATSRIPKIYSPPKVRAIPRTLHPASCGTIPRSALQKYTKICFPQNIDQLFTAIFSSARAPAFRRVSADLKLTSTLQN